MTGPVDFDAFVRARGSDLRRSVARKCGSSGLDADDVVQETWTRLLAKYADVADPDELFALALAVAHNVYRDWLKSADRRVVAASDDLDAVAGAGPVNVEQEVAHRADTSAVFGEIARMPLAERRTLALIGAGWHPREIARHLRVSSASVHSSCQRGRERLRKAAVVAGRGVLGVVTLRRVRALFASAPVSVALVSLAALTVAVPLMLTPLPASPAYANVDLAGSHPRPARADAAPDNAVRDATPRTDASARPANGTRATNGAAVASPTPAPTQTRTCVGATCYGDEDTPGAELYLKQPLPIVGGISHTQSIVNACPLVPDNDAVGCREHGDPHYVVDPSPGPTPP
jgi:RNA polymerase sigma factor (sigma-70 family)